MATLQSLRPSFRPSIPSPNSHTFPATPFNYSPKSIGSKGGSVTVRHSIVSPRVSVSNSEYSTQIAENLGDVTIFTATGEPVRFSDLWDQSQLPFPLDCLYADPDRKVTCISCFEPILWFWPNFLQSIQYQGVFEI
uniref:Uncharacterized protein n=1 Tax=Glycine max TaxID=3847 RepID=A0A0R0FE29_SOYBN